MGFLLPCVTHTIVTEVTKHTIGVVWKLERRNSILDVNVEDIVILLPVVKLLASGTNSIDDLPNFLPLITSAIPLIEKSGQVYAPTKRNILGVPRLLFHFVPF